MAPRPAGWVPYQLKDGTVIPSVTTILGKFRDPNPLMWWSYQQGKAGKDFRETRDDAASSGTLAHSLVEAFIKQKDFPDIPPTDIGRRAERAFKNFEEWAERTQLKPVESEIRLVSETHRFGGTIDLMMIGGRLSLGDLKTSGAVYVEHLLQIGAYGILHLENYPDRPLDGGYHILRLSKDEGDFAHHHYSDLTDAAEAFLHLRRAYDLVERLRARVR